MIRNGQFFDGSDRRATVSDVAISDGKVKSSGPKLAGKGRREIDAQGCWVMPGMLDIHTHYDAEVEAMPGLEESVRHGVTTVVMGNCSLSAALGEQEGHPRSVLPRREPAARRAVAMARRRDPLERRARVLRSTSNSCRLGPNVASFWGTPTSVPT